MEYVIGAWMRYRQEHQLNSQKIGVVRNAPGLISLEEQIAALLDFGVEERQIWQIGRYSTRDIIRAFGPAGDMLVVASGGVLGKDWAQLLAGIGAHGATLYDLSEGREDPISQAPVFNRIKQDVERTQLAPERVSAAKSPNKAGRKPKLEGDRRRAAQASWQGNVGSNQDIADMFGVSTTWLFNNFGARSAGRAKPNEQKPDK